MAGEIRRSLTKADATTALPIGIILVLTIAIYFQSLNNGFVHLDDYVQVVNNQNIRSLTIENLIAIFSSTSVGMYQPVTTLIYGIVEGIGGIKPVPFKSISLLIHLVNTVLAFILLRRLLKNREVSLLLTAVFATHPMQVESVAWISALSNLVYTSFYLTALIVYLTYLRNETKKSYFLCLSLFLLSCLSKSAAVTFPIALIALDYYKKGSLREINWMKKTPFLFLSLIVGLVTIFSRESAGHLSDLSVSFDWFNRLFLVSYSMFFYPLKFMFPYNLSAFYPYPDLVNEMLPLEYYGSFLVLIAVSVLLWKYSKTSNIWFGLAFFIITISLVTQVVAVGNQLTTDRYIYLPMIGLLIALGGIVNKIKSQKILYFLAVVPIILSFKAHERTKVWKTDELIWKDVLESHPNVAQAYNNLGSFYLNKNQPKIAFEHYNKAIQLKPYYADALSNRGNLFSQSGNSKAAMADFNRAIQLRPHADAYFNRANEFSKLGDLNSAIKDYSLSLKLSRRADVMTNRAFAYMKKGAPKKAALDLQSAIAINPTYDRAYFLKGVLLQNEGKFALACTEFQKAKQYGNKEAIQAIKKACR